MNKKEYINESLRMARVMNGNKFLLPRTWSATVDIDLHDWSYRTYCADSSKADDLYIHIEIHKDGNRIINFHFSGSDIIVSKSINDGVTPKTMFEYISIIFNEKHSFSEHDEGLKSLREKVRSQKSIVKSATKEIKSLEDQIKGLKELQSVR